MPEELIPHTNTSVTRTAGPQAPAKQNKVQVSANGVLNGVNPEAIMTPSHIEIGDNGIFIVFEKLSHPEDFQKTLDNWFQNNMYVEGFDIKTIEGIIFENAPKGDRLKIGTALKPIPEEQLGLFGDSIQIGRDGKARWNYFHRRELLSDPMFNDLEKEEDKFRRIQDMIVAQAWKTGRTRAPIRYGFILGNIIAGLERKSNVSVIIAEPKEAKKGKDAIVTEVFPEGKQGNIDEDSKERRRLDEGSVQQREVDEGEILYQKISATAGEPGINVSGFPEPGTPGKDTPFPGFNGATIVFEQGEGNISFLKAKCHGYVYHGKSGGHEGILEIRDKITLNGVSMNSTGGSVNLHQNQGEIIGDVTKPIEDAIQLDIGGSVLNANIRSQTYTNIKGSILGKNTAVVSSEKNRITKHDTGRVEAGTDIMVHGNIEYAYIHSDSGTFHFRQNLLGSHVSASHIVGSQARGSLIIADTVELNGASDCVIIANNVHIKNIGENVSIIFLIPEVAEEIKRLQGELPHLTKTEKEQEKKYKDELLQFGKSREGAKLTANYITTLHNLLSFLYSLSKKTELTREEKEQQEKFNKLQIPKNLVNLLRDWKETENERSDTEILLKKIESLPKNAREHIHIQLDNISGDIVTVQEQNIKVENLIQGLSEEKQQEYYHSVRDNSGKRYPVTGTTFSLKGA